MTDQGELTPPLGLWPIHPLRIFSQSREEACHPLCPSILGGSFPQGSAGADSPLCDESVMRQPATRARSPWRGAGLWPMIAADTGDADDC